MSSVWIAVLVVGAATIAIKAAGPVLAGERELPLGRSRVVDLLAPALLAALVATNTFGSGQQIVLDARLMGLGVAALAIALRAPVLVVVVVAAAAAATARLLGMG